MTTQTQDMFNPNSTAPNAGLDAQNSSQIPAVNLENVADFSNVCRTCATITEFVIPIFHGDGIHNNLAEKLHKHLPIRVSDQDELPHVVCYQCASTLLAWHELVECCVQAEKALQTAVRNRLLAAEASRAAEPKPGTSSDVKPQVNKIVNKLSQSSCENDIDMKVEDNESNYSIESHNPLYDDNEFETDSDDNIPLSSISHVNKKQAYEKFYKALVTFANHYNNDHPDTSSDSSDSDNIVDFDDLTQCNMRNSRLDEETRLDIAEAKTKINGKVYYTCKLCGSSVTSTSNYLAHKRIHSGERPYVCHICGKRFRSSNGLQRHVTQTHERQRRHSCSICSKLFANSHNLKQHMRIHTGDRPYVCSQCGKSFAQSGSLYSHMKTHAERFPYSCAECSAKFKLKSGLTRHNLKHTGERPHVCSICERTFKQKHDLNLHVTSHSTDVEYPCRVCGALFKQGKALRLHQRRMHKTQP